MGKAFSFSSNQEPPGAGAVVIQDDPSLHLEDFTLEAWLQRGSTDVASYFNPDACILCYGSLGYGLLLLNDGSLGLNRLDNGVVWSAPVIQDTTYRHVAVTKSGNEVRFYADGNPTSSDPYHLNFGFTFTGTPFGIGNRGDLDAGVNTFYGVVDEPSVYNRALSQEEIRGIFNAGSAGKCLPIPVAKFSPKVAVKLGNPRTVSLASSGNLLSAESNGIHPADEPVRLKIGNASADLPPHSLQKNGALYTFKGTVADGTELELTVVAGDGARAFSVQAKFTGPTLNGEWDSPVTLSIGDDKASAKPTAMSVTYQRQ